MLISVTQGARDRDGAGLRVQFIVRGRTVRVSGTLFDCNSDGEIDGPFRERTWRVLPAAYTMLVPS